MSHETFYLLLKLMVQLRLKDSTAAFIRPSILQRVYPIEYGPEARTPLLKLQNVSCRRRPLTNHPRLHLHRCEPRRIDCERVLPGASIVYPQAPRQNTGVGGALWGGGANGSIPHYRCYAKPDQNNEFSPHEKVATFTMKRELYIRYEHSLLRNRWWQI